MAPQGQSICMTDLEESAGKGEINKEVLAPSSVRKIPHANISERASLASYARLMIEERACIHKYIRSVLISDPALDILLDLYASHEEGVRSTIGSVAKAARVPTTTGLRYINALVSENLVERRADPLDKRRVFLNLSSSGRNSMDLYLKNIFSMPSRR